MRKIVSALIALGIVLAIGRAGSSKEELTDYLASNAAPAYHKPLLENEFVLVLDVSIPPGITVPAHVHPWPAVFITLQPADLVFRNLAGEIVREIRSPSGAAHDPKVEWREPDEQPASVANVGTRELRALRIELKFLGSGGRRPTSR